MHDPKKEEAIAQRILGRKPKVQTAQEAKEEVLVGNLPSGRRVVCIPEGKGVPSIREAAGKDAGPYFDTLTRNLGVYLQ